MEYVLSHLGEILTAVTAVIAAASAIANLTPSNTDNKIIAVISKVVNALALNFKK